MQRIESLIFYLTRNIGSVFEQREQMGQCFSRNMRISVNFHEQFSLFGKDESVCCIDRVIKIFNVSYN